MKLILAIIRPQKGLETRQALEAAGVSYITRRALGRSRQGGLRYGRRRWFKRSADIQFLPKRFFEIVVEDHQLPAVVAAILQANQTGGIGDGKIFVLPAEEVLE